MSIKKEILKPDSFYHLYNDSMGNDKLFFNEDNYLYFLTKFSEYISPVGYTYAYCLIPNHFHFLIQLKSEADIFDYLITSNKIPESDISLNEFKKLSEGDNGIDYFNLHITKLFGSFFNGYSQALNKQQNRKGNLFIKGFRRKIITTEDYLKDLVMYIHTNPVHHQQVAKIVDWRYSSYSAMLSEKPTKLKRESVLELFDGKENFIASHQTKAEIARQKIEGLMNE
jgi:REP element-mobilizing transposase RayT